MSDRNQMNRTLIETAQAIAAERPRADVEAAATGRVRQALAVATAGDAVGADAPDADVDANATLTSCADYQARMPALVAGTLPEAQRLLVEDHTRECIPCRKHLQAIRAGRAVSDVAGPAAPARVGRYYAAAAAMVGVAVAGVWISQRVLLPPQDGIVQVRSVDGRMFVAGDDRGADLVPLGPGDAVDGGVPVRTGAGSRAVLELADGSRVEAAGLTTFRVDARRSGHRVRVDRGSVIVQAAQQDNGSLIVSTAEMLVAVKGTIFAVTHGVKGSRVSVIEGEVEVEKGRERHSLLAGDQFRSRPTLVAMTLQEEVGWSQDADRYLALLEEFRSLRSELNQLMEAAPARHSTRLLDLMPAHTKIYVAMPNAPATLSDL
ncbi:MAG: FecR domain-containing protein, partial [Acidobacteriota bacterium]|nr:FecR domain-containing protein [Acidobacteriota bacterium]